MKPRISVNNRDIIPVYLGYTVWREALVAEKFGEFAVKLILAKENLASSD